jgi:hypothetical protein
LRVRSVQGRLSIEFGDEDAAGGDDGVKADPPSRNSGFRRPARPAASDTERGRKSAAPIFHPLAYRSVVADWPVEWREHWGRRSNQLEESGLSWRDAEARAFVEVWHRYRAVAGATAAVGPTTTRQDSDAAEP